MQRGRQIEVDNTPYFTDILFVNTKQIQIFGYYRLTNSYY